MEEPWLRETELSCDPAVAAVVFALQQAEKDLVRFVPPPSAEFHLRHIAGSLDRLSMYLLGGELSEQQLARLRAEDTGNGESREELLEACRQAFARTRELILTFPAEQLSQARFVGRKQIRTSAIGLMIHMAEHTQRHVGQIIAYSRLG